MVAIRVALPAGHDVNGDACWTVIDLRAKHGQFGLQIGDTRFVPGLDRSSGVRPVTPPVPLVQLQDVLLVERRVLGPNAVGLARAAFQNMGEDRPVIQACPSQ